MTQQLFYCTMYEWASVAQRSATRGDVPESPFPHMDMELSMLACGKPSFTPTLNTTTPAVSLSSASQCSVGLCLGCDSVTNTTSPQCLRNPQGREGGTRQQQHAMANEVTRRSCEADKGRRTGARPFRIWIRYGCGTQCMHARPGRLAGSPAGSPRSHPH